MSISEKLLEQIKKNDPNLTVINLSRYQPSLTTHELIPLMLALKDNSYVHGLVFCESDLDDQSANVLASALSNLPSITSLDVSVNEIGETGLLALFKIPSLENLDVSSNDITDKAAKELLNN